MTELLILAHADAWEKRFQVSSLAASVAAAGKRVDIALFFAALSAWATDAWDLLDPAPPLEAQSVEAHNFPPLSSLIADGRDSGLIRLYACSASTRLLGLDPGVVQERVEAIVGWQSFSRMIEEATRVVTL